MDKTGESLQCPLPDYSGKPNKWRARAALALLVVCAPIIFPGFIVLGIIEHVRGVPYDI